MANQESTMRGMAERGETQALEDRWLVAIESPDADRGELLDVLAALARNTSPENAAPLGWMWLTSYREKAKVQDALALGRDLLLICGDNTDLRNDVLDLYRKAYADRPDIEPLIEASGLAGGRSPRRALRTLDICLNLSVGDFLIDRSTDKPAQVVAADTTACTYTVRAGQREEILDPDALALAYDPADPNDFRVLTQLRPDRLAELAESDPTALIIGLLRTHHRRIDSDHLELALCPRVIPTDKWAGWWSKAKTALRRHRNVVVEGRNPVILTYHAAGQSLEEEMEPQWAQADSATKRLAVAETYFREAKARKVQVQPGMVRRMVETLRQKVEASRKGSPAHALTEALIIDRIAENAPLPEGAARLAADILAGAADTVRLFNRIKDTRLYTHALELVRQVFPDRWPDLYLKLLTKAPTEACDAIAKALHEGGRLDDLRRTADAILADLGSHLDAACWLWEGPSVPELEPVPRRELLPRLLEYLHSLALSDNTPADLLRNARARIRAALSHDNYAHFREIITGMEAGMASTVYRTVDRAQGLGQVVHSTLLKIIRETHPSLFTKARTDPWLDDNIIFCTSQGMQKQEAELNHLQYVKIPENAKAIGEAASHGDLSENSEFKFALEERDLLQARLLRAQQDLARARLITANDVSTHEVGIGTKVTLAPVAGGEPLVFTILGPWEADGEKRIYNYRAPMCARLKGLKVGDTVKLELDDAEREYRVQTIANSLE